MPQHVNNFLNGHNISFFAYGQTGSGKTFTMIAPQGSLNAPGGVDESGKILPHYGLFPRTALNIYNTLSSGGGKFILTASVL